MTDDEREAKEESARRRRRTRRKQEEHEATIRADERRRTFEELARETRSRFPSGNALWTVVYREINRVREPAEAICDALAAEFERRAKGGT